MVSLLREFPSNTFYEGALIDGKKHEIPHSLQIRAPSWFINIPYGKEEILKRSYQNEEEAKIVIFLVSRLLKKDD